MISKGQGPKDRKGKNYSSFIESLRDLSSGVGRDFVDDFIKETPKDVFQQTGLKNFANHQEGSADLFNPEHQKLQQKIHHLEALRRQEKVVFSAREQEVRSKITLLYEEVRKLAQTNVALSKEVKIAAIQAPINPGVYHVTFVEKLISFIQNLNKNLNDATHWLSETNSKKRKRSYYWQQVKTSQTKFMLSQERYMATQVG